MDNPGLDLVADLTTGEDENVVQASPTKVAAVEELVSDWSHFEDESGQQLQTVSQLPESNDDHSGSYCEELQLAIDVLIR
jgi:hypothetical protein